MINNKFVALSLLCLTVYSVPSVYSQSDDILRIREYTLEEWYFMDDPIGLHQCVGCGTEGYKKQTTNSQFLEKKYVRKLRNRQCKQLLEGGAIVNHIEPIRVSSFRDRDGYILSKQADFGRNDDGGPIVIYLPMSITFNGTLTIRLDSEFGPIIGYFDFTKTDRHNKKIESCILNYSNITGRHDVYFFYPYEYNGHDLSGFPSRDSWLLIRNQL